MSSNSGSATMASASMDSMMSAMSTMSSHISSMSRAMASASTMVMPTSASSMAGMSMPMPTSGGSMGGMGGMDMGGEDQCIMEMSWNWNTINSCFLSRGWHVKTRGQFAGTCIGVFLWVVFLCLLSRARRGLDSYIMHNGSRKLAREELQQGHYVEPSAAKGQVRAGDILQCTTEPLGCSENVNESTTKVYEGSASQQSTERLLVGAPETKTYRPNVFEQLMRALLYGLEYSITWLLALIIMSYNGYVIVCAFLGATLGFMIVNWEKMKPMANEPFTAQPVCC